MDPVLSRPRACIGGGVISLAQRADPHCEGPMCWDFFCHQQHLLINSSPAGCNRSLFNQVHLNRKGRVFFICQGKLALMVVSFGVFNAKFLAEQTCHRFTWPFLPGLKSKPYPVQQPAAGWTLDPNQTRMTPSPPHTAC